MVFTFSTYFIIFISGLFIGSFLNLVADRLNEGKGILIGRSICNFCTKNLSFVDLVPIFSYLFLGGKCRQCGHKISLYYPISEITTGFLFVMVGYWLKIHQSSELITWLAFLFYIVISSIFIIVLFSDLKYMMIPDKVIIPGIVLTMVFQLSLAVYYSVDLYNRLNSDSFGKYLVKAGYVNRHALLAFQGVGVNFLAGISISLFFLALIFITKGRGMGGGDVKLGFLIGLLNGFPNSIVAIFSAFLTGAIYSLILVIARRKKFKESIAFGPFLVVGNYIALLYGSAVIEWYIHIL